MTLTAQPGPGPESRFNRILLIDDEPGIRKMLSLDLKADGYDCLTAEDGRTGLEVFKSQQPDIVLTDIKMPGLDGLEVLRRIKKANPRTEVIVITGHGDIAAAIQSLQMEASDFITKPISDDALAVALKRAAQRLEMKDRLERYTTGLEEQVARTSAKLIQAERLAAIGQTTASLAHTVKNIMGGLKGGLYVARQGRAKQDGDMTDQGLEMLERNIGRISDFVGDLLTMAKDRCPETAPTDPTALAAEAVEVMADKARRAGVALEFKDREPFPALSVDRKALLGAVLNVLANAIEAASEGTDGRVEVHLAEECGHLVFSIVDNGPGFAPEAANKVFKGFFSTKGSAGTGLGLMVAQKTVCEHGGRIELDNRPGLGARLSLHLPLEPPCRNEPEGGGSPITDRTVEGAGSVEELT